MHYYCQVGGKIGYMALKIENLTGPMGAIIWGLDSARPLTPEEFTKIEQVMLDRVAIVIPDLEENVTWLRDFGRQFGPLVPHVLDQYHHPASFEVSIIARHMGTPQSRTTAIPAGAFWHSDLSYEEAPSDAIFLYATHLPTEGGDTMVANMSMAYDSLPDSLKTKIDGLTATHRWGWNTGGGTPKLNHEQQNTHPDVVHPVVRRHPKTGRSVLYVNPGYTMKINDVSPAESGDLLDTLFTHALNPEFHYRHKWALGSMIGLDNRASMHCAVNDYTEPRQMLRMIVGCTEHI